MRRIGRQRALLQAQRRAHAVLLLELAAPGIAAGLFGRALLSYTGGDVVVIATWTGLYALTLGILLFKLSLQLYRFVPVEVSAQRGGLFAFRASARSRRHRAR